MPENLFEKTPTFVEQFQREGGYHLESAQYLRVFIWGEQ